MILMGLAAKQASGVEKISGRRRALCVRIFMENKSIMMHLNSMFTVLYTEEDFLEDDWKDEIEEYHEKSHRQKRG